MLAEGELSGERVPSRLSACWRGRRQKKRTHQKTAALYRTHHPLLSPLAPQLGALSQLCSHLDYRVKPSKGGPEDTVFSNALYGWAQHSSAKSGPIEATHHRALCNCVHLVARTGRLREADVIQVEPLERGMSVRIRRSNLKRY